MPVIDLANPSRFRAVTDRVLPWLASATVLAFAIGVGQIYLAPDDYQQGATAKIIDEEIRRLIDEAETTARRILTENLDDLHKVANALLEYETLSGDEVKALMRGEQINRPDDTPTPTRPRSSVPSSGTPAHSGRPGPTGLEPEPQPGS
jgi:hypothetical protein